MLPDFPESKKRCLEILVRRFKANKSQTIGIWGKGKRVIQEGNKTVSVREGGEENPVNMTHLEERIEFDADEFLNMSDNEFIERMDPLSEKMGNEVAKAAIKELDSILKKKDRVIQTSGEFSPEHIFQSLESVDIEFDDEGNPRGMAVLVSPALAKIVPDIIKELEENSENKQRFEAIMDKKREESRVRESNRKLVD